MYLFGYGSLINLQSAQKSFKRELKQSDLIPVDLEGYKKVWNSIENINFDNKKEMNGVFLNLEECKGSTNGVVIKISEEELEFLKIREKNYSCIEIDKEKILNISLDENLITFRTQKEEKLAKYGDKNCVIPQKYIDILTSSYSFYDVNFVEEFKKSISDYPFEIKQGNYNFSDPIQNKFTKEGISE